MSRKIWATTEGYPHSADDLAQAAAAGAAEIVSLPCVALPNLVAGYNEIPDPPAPAPVVPQQVSNFQGRAILRIYGMYDAVDNTISNISDPLQQIIAQDAFSSAPFNRNSPLLISIAYQLGHDDAFIDQMFIDAAKITV